MVEIRLQSGKVKKATFDANSILKADTDDEPEALVIPEQTMPGRITGGTIAALTPTQIRTLLNVEDGAAADLTGLEIVTLLEALAAGNRLDHGGGLAGLGDDDHTQYTLRSLLTTKGDLPYRGTSVWERLGIGGNGQYLKVATDVPAWSTIAASDVEVSELGTATYDDVQDFVNFFGDRTLLSGGTITATAPADGTVAVAACTAWSKVSDSETAEGKFFNYAGTTGQALTDQQINYIYLDYYAGTPRVVVATALLTYALKLDHILLGVVFRNGTATHIHNADHIGISGIGRSNLHWTEHSAVHRVDGAVTTSTGTRNLAVTAGVVYAGLTRNLTAAFDTSAADTFSYWYYDGDLGIPAWVEVTGATQISRTQYNNIASGLASLTSNRFGVHWVYLDNDGVHLHVVYGQGNYTAALAELAAVPATLPPLVTGYCVLIAKIICQEGTDVLTIAYPWTAAFATSLATDHGSLAGLLDDDHTQYALRSLLTTQDDIVVRGASVWERLAVGSSTILAKLAAGNLVAATPAEIRTLLALVIGTNVLAEQTIGIADENLLEVDDAAAADDDFARFTANGIEGIPVATAIAALLAAALPENTAIILDAVLSADGKYSGIVEAGTAGAALAFGDIVYLAVADSKWELAKADAAATSKGKIGMVVLAAAEDAATTILLYGKIRAATLPALTVGAPVHISAATAGDVAVAAPTGTTNFVVRIIGYGVTAEDLMFCPDNTYIELA